MSETIVKSRWRFFPLLGLILLAMVGTLVYFEVTPVNFNNEFLEMAIPKYQHQLERRQELMQVVRERTAAAIPKLNVDVAVLERKINALRFKLDTTSQYDLLNISLLAMQIMDLKTQSDISYDAMHNLNGLYADAATEVNNISIMLSQIDPKTLTKSEVEKISACRQTIAELNTEIQAGQETLTPINVVADKITHQLSSLLEEGEERRNDAFELCFFTRGGKFTEVIHYGILPLKFWLISLPDTIDMLIPDDAVFWFNFFGLLLFINVPMFFIGKYYIFKHLVKNTPLSGEYTASRIWPVGTLCIGIGLAAFLAHFLIGVSLSSGLLQAGYSAIYLGCLLLALAFRIPRKRLFACFMLYVPSIIIATLARGMYCTLIFYTPLVMIIPPLCLIGTLILIFMLFRHRYPMLDTSLSILTILVYLGAGYLAFIGLPYLGFTAILIWLSRVIQFLVVLTLTQITLRSIKANPQRNHFNNFLSSLWIPSLWGFLLCSFVINLTSTYHLSDWNNMFFGNLPLPEQICSFSVFDLAIIISAFFVMRFLIRFGRQLVIDIYREEAEAGTIPSFMTLGAYIAWTFYVLFVLITLSVNPSSILVVLGGFSMGVGFAMKEVLENFVAGIILLVGQHVRPGDIIEFDGIMGRVKTVNFRATVVEAFDGSVITLPNTRVIGKDFRNWTRNHKLMRKNISIGVSYNADMDLVRKILMEVATSMPTVFKYPRPTVLCDDFADSSVNFVVRIWISAANFPEVSSEYRERVFAEFQKNGIEIPFPQMDVHMIENQQSNGE